MLFIKNIIVCDPASGLLAVRDICIRDGRVVKMGEAITQEYIREEMEAARKRGEEYTIVDGTGLTAAPGIVDAHVHFRDPGFTHKEDIQTGAAAAAAGGVTTVVLMANTRPCVDQEETLHYVLQEGLQTGINVETCANVTIGMKGQELTDMAALKAAGAVGFTDDGIPLLDEDIARSAMKTAARLKVPISFHEENPAFIENNGINRGKASAGLGIGGSDRQAEIDLVERDVRLAQETGAAVVIQHISTKEAVELVRRAKADGTDIHAEATPHHFTLTEDAVARYGTLAKMNPPLREEADRLAIVEGLADGTIDMIATDHAPHTAEEKAQAITDAPSGITGLETVLPLSLMQLCDTGKMTLPEVFERLSLAPARLYGLDAGYLAEGGPADLVIFDREETWVAQQFHSRSSNTPFKGWELKGKVKITICNGRIIWQDEARNQD